MGWRAQVENIRTILLVFSCCLPNADGRSTYRKPVSNSENENPQNSNCNPYILYMTRNRLGSFLRFSSVHNALNLFVILSLRIPSFTSYISLCSIARSFPILNISFSHLRRFKRNRIEDNYISAVCIQETQFRKQNPIPVNWMQKKHGFSSNSPERQPRQEIGWENWIFLFLYFLFGPVHFSFLSLIISAFQWIWIYTRYQLLRA